jgi:hypothetical protein
MSYRYRALWSLELTFIALFFLVLVLPMQDFAMREYKEYMQNPSKEPRKAFEDKRQEELRVRRDGTILIATGVLALTIPLYRNRPRNPTAPVP